MSSFSDQNFVKKLSELNGTQQSIQTLALWLIHHRKHSKSIIQVWYRELQKVSPQKRLTFMYLANDVIQNSKKKGPEFTRDFGSVLAEAFKVGVKDAEEKVRKSMERLLSIWEERGVYSKEFIRQVKQAKEGEITAADILSDPIPKKKRKREESKEEIKEEVKIIKPEEIENIDSEELVKKLSDLENSASCDAAVREQIAALPPEVSDISQLTKINDKESARRLSGIVDDACLLLSEYNKRLTDELEDRKKVAKMLRGFIIAQRNQLVNAEKRLSEYKVKLAKVTTVRQELKSHIDNLPDITLLPRVTGGLAPLPSAGDLFH